MKDKVYTTQQVATICRVSLKTIIRWIDDGRLESFKTPGGHRRIFEKNLIKFFEEYNLPLIHLLSSNMKKKILVVDDEERMVKNIIRILKSNGKDFEFAMARDGYEACFRIGTFHPDLVILDIKVPRLDGLDVCKLIRIIPQLEKLKILAMTGYPKEISENMLLEAGADCCLFKPFSAKELRQSAEELLT